MNIRQVEVRASDARSLKYSYGGLDPKNSDWSQKEGGAADPNVSSKPSHQWVALALSELVSGLECDPDFIKGRVNLTPTRYPHPDTASGYNRVRIRHIRSNPRNGTLRMIQRVLK